MPVYIENELKNGILFVTAKGRYSLDSAIQTFIQILDSLKELNINRVLIDCCLVEDFSNLLINIYDYAKQIIEECFKKNIYPELAYLLPSDTNMEIMKFGETFSNNRGIKSKVFNNFQEAVNWLEFNSCSNIKNA